MFTIDFDQLTEDVKAIDLDVYKVNYGPVPWPVDKAQDLHDRYIREQYIKFGLTGEKLEEFCKQPMTWAEMNTGKLFNFWHFCYGLMEASMVTTENYHYGKCVIKRNMVDPEELEDPINLLLYPYIVKAGKYSAPVIDKILNYYKVDEMEITTEVGR